MARRPNQFTEGLDYPRYFFGHSDRKLLNRLASPTDLLEAITGENNIGRTIKNELIVIELRQVKEDVHGLYGVLVVPRVNPLPLLPKIGPYKLRGLSPIEPNSPSTDLVFLNRFDLNSEYLGESGPCLSKKYKGSVLVPYRTHITGERLNKRLNKKGFPCVLSLDYSRYINFLIPDGIYMEQEIKRYFGVIQNPQIHIHQIKPDESQLLSLARQKLDIPRF